jgi:hypothetical protein
MDGILNEHTQTVHRHEAGEPALDTVCGASNGLDSEQLRAVSVEKAAADHDTDRCGRCFDDGGGY